MPLLTGVLLGGCALLDETARSPAQFKPIERATSERLLDKDELALLEETEQPVYQIGRGDTVRIDVFGRPEVSGKHVVGPDGNITLPIAGEILVADSSREQARARIEDSLRAYYLRPHVTLGVDDYPSNQITVLGRVDRAGMQRFPHRPTLAEVLAGAGALSTNDKQSTMSRCAIMRGRDKLIWVDLKALLNGDTAYNLRMKKGDIVFIPDSADTSIYVLGQVARPGSYRLTPRMTLLDAIAQAGGLNEDAKRSQIGIYRAGIEKIERLSFDDLIDPHRDTNYALEEGDVVFVPRQGLADFGYFMRQISPGLSVLSFGLSLKAVTK